MSTAILAKASRETDRRYPGIYRTRRPDGTVYENWRFDYTDEFGHLRTVTGTESAAETARMAKDMREKCRLTRRGLIPTERVSVASCTRPIREVFEEYVRAGVTRGGIRNRPWSREHARKRRAHFDWWRRTLNLSRLGELAGITPRVEKALQKLAAERLAAEKLAAEKRAGKTLNSYLETLYSFCLWCADEDRGYLDANPLPKMRKLRFSSIPKTQRRALTRDEYERLVASASVHRGLLYRMAVTTGMRANELRSLSVTHVNLERGTIHMEAQWTKNGDAHDRHLPPELLPLLRDFIASGEAVRLYRKHYRRRDAKRVIPSNPLLFVPPTHCARLLRQDLKTAGIAFNIPGQGKVDFHALRVTGATFIAEAGATPVEIQDFLRHRTPGLATKIYTRVRPGRVDELMGAVSARINTPRSGNLPEANPQGAETPTVSSESGDSEKRSIPPASTSCAERNLSPRK